MPLFVNIPPAVSSNRYDNTSGGAIEVISPASSPVQSQQDKPEEGQQPAGEGKLYTLHNIQNLQIASSCHLEILHTSALVSSVPICPCLNLTLASKHVFVSHPCRQLAFVPTTQVVTGHQGSRLSPVPSRPRPPRLRTTPRSQRLSES